MKNIFANMLNFREKDQVKEAKCQSVTEKVSKSQSLTAFFKGSCSDVIRYFSCVLSRITSMCTRNAQVNGSIMQYAATVLLLLCLGVGM